LLIETLGYDVNAQNNNDDTPIHRAIDSFNPYDGGDISVLQYLFNQTKAHVNIKGKYGHTLLHRACEKINYLPLDVFKFLIETMGFDVNVQDDNKNTPLHNAFRCLNPRYGDINVLIYLLSQEGINGNIVGQYDWTLLYTACFNINNLPIDIFKLLIETIGCDVNAQANNKNTPIHRALCSFDPNKGGDISVLQYLFNQTEVHVSIKDKDGYTLLHYACDMINDCPLVVFKLLIETMGCDVNAQNTYNDTPIHIAFRCFVPGNSDTITALTYLINQTKVHVNIKGKDGSTLLHYACEKIRDLPLKIFKLLIGTHGADVNIQDNDNDTPLHCAFRHFEQDNGGNTKLLTYLINQQTVNVNIKGKKGHTILHSACINNLSKSRSFVKLNAKADSNLCQIVEDIIERCVQQVLDETTP
jgi:ankyrin repeat protein